MFRRSGSLCSNSLIFSSPSSLSVSVLPPDLSVHSVASSATLQGANNSRTSSQKVRQSIDLDLLDQLPESRVDLSPDSDLTPSLLLSPEDLPSSPKDLVTLKQDSQDLTEELLKTINNFETLAKNLPTPPENLPTPTRDLPAPVQDLLSPTEDITSTNQDLPSPPEVLSSQIKDLTSVKGIIFIGKILL